MTSAATVIYLPCDVVPVRARIAIGDGLSPIEKIVLRAIEARPSTASELSELLGLGDRVTVDVLHGLWRYGHLRIDFNTRKIDVSHDIRLQIANGKLDTVAGIDSEEIQQELMIEKLTGHVLPCSGPKAPPQPKLAIDHPRADITLEGAAHTAIAAALNRVIEAAEMRTQAHREDNENTLGERTTARAGRGRPRRVRSILATPGHSHVPSGRRWLPVEIRTAINPDTERLVVTVTDRRFPAERRSLLGDLLTQIASDFPRDSFVTMLRSAVDPKLYAPPSLRDSVARLATDADRTAGIPAGQRTARHRELCDSARQLGGLLSAWIRDEVAADVVLDADHSWRIDELISRAEQQLVIVSPRINETAMKRVEAKLRTKIRAGVRIVILWGSSYEDTIKGPAENILNSLQRERGGAPMLRPLISARTQARIVIADDIAALVTSHNILSSSGGGLNLGVLIRSTSGGRSQAIQDLLERVRMLVPDAKTSRQLATRIQAPGAGEDAVPPVSPLPEAPPDEAGNDPRVTSAVTAWTAAWQALAQEISGLLDARSAPVATPVADGAHSELLWQALRNAQTRVVIASGRLGARICNQRFRRAVSDCLARGATVTIAYDGLMEGQDSVDAAAELERLAASHPGKLHLRPGSNNAKVLVWDDEAVVGSFDYLSHGERTTAHSFLLPSDLSIRLSGAQIARRVATAAGAPADTANATAQPPATALPPAGVQSPGTVTDPATARAAQLIRNQALTGVPLGGLLAAELDTADDPWKVLDAMQAESGGTDDVVTAVAAHCVLKHAATADPRNLDGWTRRLILACWTSGRFIEAALLRCAYGDEQFRPRPWLTVLAAVRDIESQCELALIAAEDIELLDSERPALLLVAVTRLLLDSSSWVTDVVSAVAAGATGVWRELADGALDYAEHAPGQPPRQVLRVAAAPRRRAEKRSASWSALDQALARSRHVPVDNSPGRKAHYALFGPAGVFGRIAEAAPRRDHAALRAAHTEALEAGRNASAAVGGLVDRTWAEVAPAADPLQGKRRARYLDRLASVLKAAGDILDAEPHDDSVAGTGQQQDETDRARAERLGVLCAEARRAAGTLAGPECHLVLAALSDLDRLVLLERP